MNKYQLPDLPYGLGSLEPVYAAGMLELHHGKHHAGYVRGANDALDKLAELRKSGDKSAMGKLAKDISFNVSGHILHSLFWNNMSPTGGGDPEGALATALQRDFGSIDNARELLMAAGLSLQGSGWACLAWEPIGKGLVVEQIHDHQEQVISGAVPLLVIDCWEHAYYLQYKNEKAKWLKKFWDIVNWTDVSERFTHVSQ